jgi:hypothetical protein
MVPNTPFCRELRSKKIYMLGKLPLTEEDVTDDSNHCWCYNTKNPVGPDGGIVIPERCKPGRSCYVSGLVAVKKKNEVTGVK